MPRVMASEQTSTCAQGCTSHGQPERHHISTGCMAPAMQRPATAHTWKHCNQRVQGPDVARSPGPQACDCHGLNHLYCASSECRQMGCTHGWADQAGELHAAASQRLCCAQECEHPAARALSVRVQKSVIRHVTTTCTDARCGHAAAARLCKTCNGSTLHAGSA